MYRFQAALVIRTGLILFFIFFFTQGFSQEKADSAALLKDSETLLVKKINFIWKGGKLPALLDQLGAEHGLKFAYSEDKIENVMIEAETFSDVPMSEILASVLNKSEFNYLVIGRTIAIVNDPKLPKRDISSDEEVKRKANSSVEQDNESHVYPASSLSGRISSEEEKLLRKIYGKELKLTARHRSESNEKGKDTVEAKKKTSSPVPLIAGKSWYVRANLGLNNYLLRYRNVSSLNWKEELNFISKPKRSVFAEAEFGLVYNRLIFATGFGIHKLSLESTYSDSKAPPPPPGPAPAPPPPDTKVKVITEDYSMISIPLHVMMYGQHKNIYFAAGGGIRSTFIRRVSGKGSLKDYYNKNVKPEKFSESISATSFGISLRGEAGFKASEHILLSGGLEGIFYIKPYMENSLYKFYPHSLSLKLSVLYFFH